jgi:hypothetical protein
MAVETLTMVTDLSERELRNHRSFRPHRASKCAMLLVCSNFCYIFTFSEQNRAKLFSKESSGYDLQYDGKINHG